MAEDEIRGFASQLAAFIEGFTATTTAKAPDVRPAIAPGREVRRAKLYTEFVVGDQKIAIEAVGARGCSTQPGLARVDARTTEVVSLSCDLTYFAADDTPVGPVRVFQDPRIENLGWIYLRRNRGGRITGPALSFFNQHLIFRVGERYLYYPRAWQVVAAIDSWPPEFTQYHHLEEDTPLFDFVSREPNVARKGISTISIEGPISDEEEQRIVGEVKREIERVEKLPASKMAPEALTPAQAPDGKR